MEVLLGYGKERLSIILPDNSRISALKDFDISADEHGAVWEVLRHPI
jgi:hypothetical protein